MNYVKRALRATGLVLLFVPAVLPSNNTNRWIPILERPESYVFQKRSHLTASFMYTAGSTADKRSGGKVGIPELWGKYDLKDVINSYLQVNTGLSNPVFAVTGSHALEHKSMMFKLAGKIETVGLLLDGQYNLGWQNLWVGARLPVMSLRNAVRYDFNQEQSAQILSPQEKLGHTAQQLAALSQQRADKIRRSTHDSLGFSSNQFTKNGFGDLDVYIRWHKSFDHALLARTIDTALQSGVLIPTGIGMDHAIPGSIPAASDGHWGMYGDWVTGVELKQDLTVGLMLGFTHLFSHTKERRIAIGNEPTIFSALTGRVRVDPGFSFKCSPYLELGNLTDGLDFQARYSYFRHEDDNWRDERVDKTIKSYLQGDESLIASKKGLTRWRAHYVSLALRYDTAVAMEKIMFAPRFFISYDMPMNGSAFAKVHAVQLGAELQF